MELKINLRNAIEDKGLSKNLMNWGFDRCDDLTECNENEKLDVLGFRAREALRYYFNNLKYAVKEITGKFTFEECIMLMDLTNSLIVTPENNKQTLVYSLEDYREFAPFANKDDVNALINKINTLTEMQVHAVYYLCKQAWKDDSNTDEVISKYFGAKKQEEK